MLLLATLLCMTIARFAFASSPPITTVTPDVLANLKLFAEYSAAAYCTGNYQNASTTSLTCPSAVCPTLQNPYIQIADAFTNISEHQTTGLVLVDHSRQLVVISFRGTVSNIDWETDLDFLLKPANSVCPGCWIHAGFLAAWQEVQNIVENVWKGLQAQYPTYQTILTGHSLGAAIATLGAAQMKSLSPRANISLYTYGSPRVGNLAFATFVQKEFGNNNYRVTHLNDPIPRQPSHNLGYAHAGPEYHITSPNITNVLHANYTVLSEPANMIVHPSDVKVIPGPESEKGYLGYKCANVAMHDTYLVPIADCVTHQGSPLLEDFVIDICELLDDCCKIYN